MVVTKACSDTRVHDDYDDHDDVLPVQTETQIEQTDTVIDNALKEHERDDPQTVYVTDGHGKEVDVSNGNGAGVGKDEEEEDQIRPQDSISNVPPRRHGSASRASSTRSTTSSARHQAEAEQAALLARAAALKHKHALEEQELILRRQR